MGLKLALGGVGLAVIAGAVVVVVMIMSGPDEKETPERVSNNTPPPQKTGEDNNKPDPGPTPADFGIQTGSKAPPPADKLEREIRPAVEKGEAFLRKRVLTPDFAHDVPEKREPLRVQILPGVAALIGLTLLEAGAKKDDEAILRVVEIIRSNRSSMNQIYVLATSLFFLNKWNEIAPLSAEDRRLAQSLAVRIISGQLTSGVWFYSGLAMNAEQEDQMLAQLANHEFKPRKQGYYSISNTQFAILALWGARKHGVEVGDVLLATAKFFHQNQKEDGHWIYSDAEPGYAGTRPIPNLWTSSTAAGLISLAIEDAILNPKDAEFADVRSRLTIDPNRKIADRAMAFSYLNRSVGRTSKSEGGGTKQYRGTIFQADSWGDLYFLWCIERVGVIYKRDKFDDKGLDWYDWGYPIVLKHQHENGCWNDRHGDVVDTCFALLFLLRANIAKDLTEKLQLLSLGPQPEPAMSSRERTRTG